MGILAPYVRNTRSDYVTGRKSWADSFVHCDVKTSALYSFLFNPFNVLIHTLRSLSWTGCVSSCRLNEYCQQSSNESCFLINHLIRSLCIYFLEVSDHVFSGISESVVRTSNRKRKRRKKKNTRESHLICQSRQCFKPTIHYTILLRSDFRSNDNPIRYTIYLKMVFPIWEVNNCMNSILILSDSLIY